MGLKPTYLILVCAFSGALSGAVAAVFVERAMSSSSTATAVLAAPSEPPRVSGTERADAPPTELTARVVELERRVAALRSLSERLVLRQRGEEIRAESTDAVPAGSAQLDVADPVFDAAVADIIDRDLERRRAERQEKQRQKREQDIERSIAKLSPVLQLEPKQETELSQVLFKHWDKLSELRDESNPNANRDERRAQADALIKATEAELAGVLNPQQADSYRALPSKQKLKLGGRSDAEGRAERTPQAEGRAGPAPP